MTTNCSLCTNQTNLDTSYLWSMLYHLEWMMLQHHRTVHRNDAFHWFKTQARPKNVSHIGSKWDRTCSKGENKDKHYDCHSSVVKLFGRTFVKDILWITSSMVLPHGTGSHTANRLQVSLYRHRASVSSTASFRQQSTDVMWNSDTDKQNTRHIGSECRVQPDNTTRSVAASDFSVKRQKGVSGLKGQHGGGEGREGGMNNNLQPILMVFFKASSVKRMDLSDTWWGEDIKPLMRNRGFTSSAHRVVTLGFGNFPDLWACEFPFSLYLTIQVLMTN